MTCGSCKLPRRTHMKICFDSQGKIWKTPRNIENIFEIQNQMRQGDQRAGKNKSDSSEQL